MKNNIQIDLKIFTAMKKSIFALSAALFIGLFSACDPMEKDTPVPDTYRTHLTGDWYVTDWYGHTNIVDGDLSNAEFFSFDYTEEDNFLTSFSDDGMMTQKLTTGAIVNYILDFEDYDSEVKYGNDNSIYGNFTLSDGYFSGLITLIDEVTLHLFIDAETSTYSFECKRKL